MTLTEAEEILDIVSAALQDASHRRHPVSALQGHDLREICIALKLRIANERLQLAHRPEFEEQFAEGLKLYGSIPWQIMGTFVPDDQVDTVGARGVFNPIDPKTMTFEDARMAEEETASSFGEYCKGLAPDDQRYWEKVYSRIGLDPPEQCARLMDNAVPVMKRPNDHAKSAITIGLDLMRWLCILAATGYLILLLWRWNWIVAIVAFIPLLVIVMNVVGFATLPFYLITPENRHKARWGRAIRDGDFEKAKSLGREFAARFNVEGPEDEAERHC